MKYAAGSCVLSALNERSSSDCITPSNGERFAGVSGGMALATGLFTPAALNTRSKAPAERQTRVRAIGFKDSSLRFRRGRELFSVRQPGKLHKRLPLFVYMYWTAKLAGALHFATAIPQLRRQAQRSYSLGGVNSP